MTERKARLDELSDLELTMFIENISKELAKMAEERGLHLLLPSLQNTEIVSGIMLKKVGLH